jgi:hypothetical protein
MKKYKTEKKAKKKKWFKQKMIELTDVFLIKWKQLEQMELKHWNHLW